MTTLLSVEGHPILQKYYSKENLYILNFAEKACGT
jgi:hypothetical protein